jgi:hypothetical protein
MGQGAEEGCRERAPAARRWPASAPVWVMLVVLLLAGAATWPAWRCWRCHMLQPPSRSPPARASAAHCRPRRGAHCCCVMSGGTGRHLRNMRAAAASHTPAAFKQRAAAPANAAARARATARRRCLCAQCGLRPHLPYATAVSRSLSVSPGSMTPESSVGLRLLLELARGLAWGFTAGSGSRACASSDPVGSPGAA